MHPHHHFMADFEKALAGRFDMGSYRGEYADGETATAFEGYVAGRLHRGPVAWRVLDAAGEVVDFMGVEREAQKMARRIGGAVEALYR